MQNIRQIEWEEVRAQVFAANPVIAAQIDAIPKQDHPPLYFASYPFGENIVKEGEFQVPFEGQTLPLKHLQAGSACIADLAYDIIPMLMMLNKTSELFLALNDKTLPLQFFYPGKILGLWPTLDTHPLSANAYYKMWSLAAGARTIFLTPKVMDSAAYVRLQRQLQLEEIYRTHNLFDQGLIFKAIASSKKINCLWQSDILLFSKAWVTTLKAGTWPELRQALLQQEWDDSLFLRNHLRLEILDQILSTTQAQSYLKPTAYASDTVKHLISIASNAALGFTPLTQKDEIYAPISIIQKAYLEHYGLKQYIPTLIAPAYIHDRPAVYYSFLSPTLLSLSPNHNFRNTLEDERNIKYLLELFKTKIKEYPTYRGLFPEQVQFDFFHFEADAIYGIYAMAELEKLDPALSYFAPNKALSFSENSPFLRSSVRMSVIQDAPQKLSEAGLQK